MNRPIPFTGFLILRMFTFLLPCGGLEGGVHNGPSWKLTNVSLPRSAKQNASATATGVGRRPLEKVKRNINQTTRFPPYLNHARSRGACIRHARIMCALYRAPCTALTSCTSCNKTWATTGAIYICQQCPLEQHVLCASCRCDPGASHLHAFRIGRCLKGGSKKKKKRPSMECACGSRQAWTGTHVCEGRIDPASRLNEWRVPVKGTPLGQKEISMK